MTSTRFDLLIIISGVVAIITLVFIFPLSLAEGMNARNNLQNEIVCNDLDMEAVYEGIFVQYVESCKDEQQVCEIGYIDEFVTLKDCEKIVGVKK